MGQGRLSFISGARYKRGDCAFSSHVEEGAPFATLSSAFGFPGYAEDELVDSRNVQGELGGSESLRRKRHSVRRGSFTIWGAASLVMSFGLVYTVPADALLNNIEPGLRVGRAPVDTL